MRGLMQEWSLTVDRIIDHAARWDGKREVVTRALSGEIVRTDYAAMRERARRLSAALAARGIGRGDRVATMGWNSFRHVEAWFAIMGMGAVCHTLNPRLFREQIVYIANHAEDHAIIVDPCFQDLLADMLPALPRLGAIIVMGEASEVARDRLPGAVDYESVIAENHPEAAWGGFDEETACALCYTSGTTGNPKGVLYTHRSNVIHTLMTLQPDVFGLSIADVVMPIVPMYHANGWGLPLSAPAVGCKLVLPGSRLDGASLHDLCEREDVTFAAAVPTVWQALLQHLDDTGGRLTTLRRVLVGGAACPESIIRRLRDHGVESKQGWGMTETSPIGSHSKLLPEIAALPFDDQVPWRLKQGRPPFGVDLKIVDDTGNRQPHDGAALGRLHVKGPTVASAYLGGTPGDILDREGFFDTGDIADIDAEGYMRIADRAKDVIKSGGEWISSIEIENIALGHPKVALCAVIAIPDPKWDERPLLVVQLRDGETATASEMLGTLEGRIAKWWMPEGVVFVPEMPLGATGKIDKKRLRERFPAAF
ncbi:long-chain-fatty-acid--CoA ligase [Sphingosinicella microcystinivorans]|uniref:long-chain-fatty-acid--CoA ligase n=1 Tax=Sphingosinicella microcystinivorans TaxID=335406 RepID=UPI0022F39147|nr:long-chain-fatty-acid--CoA ligase [Sphingosinicella microcystinivorans]WBX84518.1 long-chain-fatty-acid--CoA ligase [Sphingosinicella microcystinivorans]